MSLVQFRETMAEPVNRVMYQAERIVLEPRGKRVMAVVSLDDLKAMEALEDAADVKAAKKAGKEPGAVPLETIKSKMSLTAGKAKASRRGKQK